MTKCIDSVHSERGDGIGLLTLDLPDKKVNTLSQSTVLRDLGGVVANR